MAYTAPLLPAPLPDARTVQVEALPVPQKVSLKAWPWTSQELRTDNQPQWLRVYRTARPAFNAARYGRARIGLVNFETNCLHYGLPAPQYESDEARFARWMAGLNRAIPETPTECGALGGVSLRMGTHEDGITDVLEMSRMNSSAVTIDPAVSDSYFFTREKLDSDIDAGMVRLFCNPYGYGNFMDSKLFHCGPAYATKRGTPLVGPHLPAQGQQAFGRVRAFRRPGAGLFADDFS